MGLKYECLGDTVQTYVFVQLHLCTSDLIFKIFFGNTKFRRISAFFVQELQPLASSDEKCDFILLVFLSIIESNFLGFYNKNICLHSGKAKMWVYCNLRETIMVVRKQFIYYF
jgi:hypothetical protein